MTFTPRDIATRKVLLPKAPDMQTTYESDTEGNVAGLAPRWNSLQQPTGLESYC